MTELDGMTQKKVVQVLYLTWGPGATIPSVVVQVNGNHPGKEEPQRVARSSDQQTGADVDLYWLMMQSINEVLGITGVVLVTRTTTNLEDGQDRVNVRLQQGSCTTPKIGATARNPLWAFLCAYLMALNYLFQQTGQAVEVEVAGENLPRYEPKPRTHCPAAD